MITEWVYTFLIPKISPVLGSFSRAGNNITGGSNRVGGGGWWVVGGGWAQYRGINEARRRLESRGQVWALHGPQITPN